MRPASASFMIVASSGQIAPISGHDHGFPGGGATGAGLVCWRSAAYRRVTWCGIVRGMSIFDDLAAEQERLQEILSGLEEAQWMSPSGAPGWTIADVVLHLAQSEEGVQATAAHQRLRAGPGAVAGNTSRGSPGRPATSAGSRRSGWMRRSPDCALAARTAPPPCGCSAPTRPSPAHAGPSRQRRGSTGSDSSARTAKTHSWTRQRGSPRATRSRASRPRAYSRSASERLWLSPRCRSRARLAGSV